MATNRRLRGRRPRVGPVALLAATVAIASASVIAIPPPALASPGGVYFAAQNNVAAGQSFFNGIQLGSRRP
jgi:hypothetical protein